MPAVSDFWNVITESGRPPLGISQCGGNIAPGVFQQVLTPAFAATPVLNKLLIVVLTRGTAARFRQTRALTAL